MAAAGLFLVAVLLRVPHLGWGLPQIEEEALPMKKAFEMWGWYTGHPTLDPQTLGWPSLSFYVHLALQGLYYLVGKLTGLFANRLDFYVQYLVDNSRLVLISRAVSVAAAAGVTVVGFQVARRLAGFWAAILAGAVLTTAPLLVEHGQQVTPDILLVFFSALATARLLDVLERGRARDYVWTAIWVALGAATKYTPVVLVGVLYAAHLMRLRREGRSLRGLGLDDRRLGYAALTCVLVFCAATPYLFADMHVLRRDFGSQVLHMRQGHFGHETQSASGHWYYAARVLSPGMGLPALLLGAAGLLWAGWRARGGWGLIGLTALAYYATLGSFSTRFDRYMLPVLLPLAVGSAGLWTMLLPRLPARVDARRAAAVAFAVLALAVPLALSARYHRLVGSPSTQLLARQYMTQQVRRDRNFFVAEQYTIQLPSTEVLEDLQATAVYQRLNEAQRERLRGIPAYEYTILPMYATRAEATAFYYDLRHFEVYDYVLTSGALQRRYDANPARFPRQVQFYRDLEQYARLEQAFLPVSGARGPEIRIYRLADEGKQRLLADRGPLPSDWYTAFLDQVHYPHLIAFLESVGGDAYVRERYDVANRYYQALLDESPPEERSQWLFRSAYAQMRGGDLDLARRQFEELIQATPEDSAALANLGLVYERQGDLERARHQYERVLQVGKEPQRQEWARRRLQALGQPAQDEVSSPPGSAP